MYKQVPLKRVQTIGRQTIGQVMDENRRSIVWDYIRSAAAEARACVLHSLGAWSAKEVEEENDRVYY